MPPELPRASGKASETDAALDGYSTSASTAGSGSASPQLPAKAELLSLSQEKQLQDLFNGIDQNGSGRIEKEELRVRFCAIS